MRFSRGGATEAVVDRIDEKILRALQADARLTNAALAELVGLSPSACLVRTRRLEAEGYLLSYHARLAVERLRPTVIVYAEVTLKRHHPDDFLAFEAAIADLPEVIEAAQVSGPFDYFLKVCARDVLGWRELADSLLRSELGVDKIATHILMKETKPFVGYPL